MRVLIVTQYFWPETFRINDLARILRERGHEVRVLTGQPNYPAGRFFPGYGWLRKWRDAYAGVEVLRCPLLPRGNGRGIRLALNYLSFALSACALAPFRCRGRFDAIFVYEPSPITVALPAILLRALGRGPVLLWVLDLWPESVAAASGLRSPLALGALSRLVRFIYRRCDLVLVQSRGFVERVQVLGASPAKVRYLPGWAEEVFFQPPPDMPIAPLPAGFRIVFTGNVGVAQDFPIILEAAARLEARAEIQWIVIGDGRMAQWVRSEAAARGLADRVHLLGSFPVEHMPALCAQADCLLVTLKGEPIFALTIPAKIQAYLACGRPVIGMLDGEGARVIEEAGAGFVGPAGDSAALAKNVLRVADLPPEARARMGKAGQDYCRREFSPEPLVSRLEQWMREACDAARER